MICIRRSAAETLLAHARADAPRECCGLLIGPAGLIERAQPATNVRASETTYLIDPAEHFAAIRATRGTIADVIGAYHSHPRSAPLPSPTDLAESVGGEFLYVIAAPAARGGWRLGAFYLDQGNFIELMLVPVA
jgi:proteasome lid subunit RPN8/RPN11